MGVIVTSGARIVRYAFLKVLDFRHHQNILVINEMNGMLIKLNCLPDRLCEFIQAISAFLQKK
ncbi:hypothetical protein [Coxiella-like endosymbiont]|uniref:hypothetical protein n=1 Tax=Coxiella-like endosymbiont TaxID=1592897 RepID=UPI002868CBFF|nr:hypothetical protein [Coxiella-like endosymbiont]